MAIEKNVIKEYNIELTDEEKRKIAKISAHFDKNQKLAWSRKFNKMEELMEELEPYEEQILELMSKKRMIVDKMTDVRQEMINECVHPKRFVIFDGDVMVCKFCNGRMVLNDE